ncbi:MAG TPA: DNA-binding protein, partial [Rhodobiaceae bacterium]|nr:DNA-binding protein [Rhodobiaceae bacterium]
PHCHSSDTAFVEASGRGEIYSYSVTRQAKPPYVIAYVTLEEGVTMLTNIVDCDLEGLSIGQKVKVKFLDAGEGMALPVFAPA